MASSKVVMDDLFGKFEGDMSLKDAIRVPECGPATFHEKTEEMMIQHVKNNAVQGNADSVLRCIDEFCYHRHWMMHIGEEKAQVICSVFAEAKAHFYNSNKNQVCANLSIAQARPFTAVELGSYCGYSAVTVGRYLDTTRSEHLYCLEANAQCVQFTTEIIEFAGLNDRVTVLHSSAGDVSAWSGIVPTPIDFLLIDHEKKRYLEDLQAIESAGLLASSATVVADNVLAFNRPLDDYLTYVRDASAGPFVESKLYEGFIEYCTEKERAANDEFKDGMEVSIHR